MQFTDFKSLLYSDTLVPDIFISEYLPALKSEYVKVYLYCLFLAGKNRAPTVQDLARILDLSAETVKKGLQFMDNLGLLTWSDDGVVLADVKEKEINKLYKPASAMSPEDAARGLMANERRRQVITAINETFFSGVMSPTWLGEISRWFEIYGFEEDVMLMLFRHCCDYGGLGSAYVAKVAENWHKKGIRNAFDVDRYLREYAAMKTSSRQIHKKLRLRAPFTEYQEDIIYKWVNTFGFSMDIIERALMLSSGKLDVGLSWYDKTLSDWHEAGVDTVEKVDAHLKARKAANAAAGAAAGPTAAAGRAAAAATGRAAAAAASKYRQSNFPQREHDDALYNSLISSEFGLAGARDGEDVGAELGAGAGAGSAPGAGADAEPRSGAVAGAVAGADACLAAGAKPETGARVGTGEMA